MEGGEARIVAYTKVFAIRARLDKRVRYITDGEKTSLASSITYISNPEKTEQFFFTSALNCSSVDTALSEMMETKQQFGKMGGVLGYHFIQSFQPGEVTPEQAHAIGLEFAKRLFGKRYEVVISTHLNKHHLHNHLVVNSVSCVDGQKYHSSPESYYNDVRGTSDALCRENDLSVITPQGKGKHYAEWKAEQGGKPTVRGIIRADIDTIIAQAYTYDSFLMLLRRNGYEVRRSPNRKYTTVKPPGAKRAIRLDSLGEGYTEADILLRLSRQRHGGMAPLIIAHTVKRYRMKGKLATVRKRRSPAFTHSISATSICCVGAGGKSCRPNCPFPSSGRSFIWSGMSSNSNTFYQAESLPKRSWSSASVCWSGTSACWRNRENHFIRKGGTPAMKKHKPSTARRSNSRLPPCVKSAGSCVCAAGYNRTFRGYPNSVSRRRLSAKRI